MVFVSIFAVVFAVAFGKSVALSRAAVRSLAAMIVLFFGMFSIAGAADAADLATNNPDIIVIVVRDIDSGAGLSAEVFRGPSSAPVAFANIDESGTSKINHKCADGDQFFASPADGRYFAQVGPRYCSPTIQFLARKRSTVTKFSQAAKLFEQAGEFGKAAQAFNEVLASTPQSQNTSVEHQTFKAAAEALNVTTPTVYDPLQQKHVQSPELSAAIKQFQANNGLKANGVLGSQTLRVLADGPVSANLPR